MKHDVHTLIRYQKELVNQRRRALVDLEEEYARLENDSAQMRIALIAEQGLAQNQETGFTYALYAQSTLATERTLEAAMAGLNEEIAAVREDLHEVFQTLKQYELLAERAAAREKREENMREQNGLDEIALNRFREKQAADD